MSIAVNDKSNAGSVMLSLPVSKAEFEVIRQIASYSIPYFLGFHEVWKSASTEASTGSGSSNEAYQSPPAPKNPPIWKKIDLTQ